MVKKNGMATEQSRAEQSSVRALRDFAELAGDWFWEQDADFRFTSFFGVSTDMMRRDQSEFLGKRRWETGIDGVTEEQLAEHIAACHRHEAFRDFEYSVVGTGGEIQYYAISGMPVFDDSGAFTGYHGIGRNVTALRVAEVAIKNSERKMSQIVHGNPVPTFVIDVQHRITHWNQACARTTGRSEKEMLSGVALWAAFYGAPRPLLADLVVSGASEKVIFAQYDHASRSSLIEGAYEAEGFFPLLGDEGCWLHFTAAPLRDADGKLIGAIETLQDITLERKAQAALENLALSDGLTGVANRRRFDMALADEWKRARRYKTTLALLMIDIDHFKRYNDSYGHQAGDLCLQQVATALRDAIHRPGDVVARYGGEEFAVIMPDTDVDGAAVVSERILDAVSALAIEHSGGEGGRVSLSIGVATLTPDLKTGEDALVALADQALYQAKQTGRNRFCCAGARLDRSES
ncbi:sensor domain-containing diguanylate cyclase [Denitromonas sp.]|uniref:sensor domain-containing diguanylate cyclase n=1 Tax=Denitromonas sp. TaxID=2734609 RepID=UPI002CBB2A20|nr:sensor domain-containing diguanylate cyclase [Denitromonas sp.]